MVNLYIMADCVTGFEYILNKDNDPEVVAKKLLKEIEEKEGCKGLNKYEMALTIVRNDQQKMLNIRADANTMRKLKMVSDAIVSEQVTEKTKRESLEFARKYKQEQSARSSVQPQTGMSTMSDEERQKKIEEDRKKNLADYEAAQAAKKSAQKRTEHS